MGQQYTLTIQNQSKMSGNLCVFLMEPDVNYPEVITIAWLSKRSHPGTTVAFTWSEEYNFVWCEQVTLSGATIVASQVLPADLELRPLSPPMNQMNLDYDGGYQFSQPTHPTSNKPAGSLYIMQGPKVPLNGARVGIGMSGHSCFVVPSLPNVELRFTPHPKYYVVFGDYEQGEAMDVSQLSQAIEAKFDGTTTVTLTLNAQNLWESTAAFTERRIMHETESERGDEGKAAAPDVDVVT